jgi:hypothetical protein
MKKPTLKKYEKELMPPINMVELKKWVTDNYGKRCKRHCFMCPSCSAWRVIEDLEILLKY